MWPTLSQASLSTLWVMHTSILTTSSKFVSNSLGSRVPGQKWKSSAKSPQSTSSPWTTLSSLNTNLTQLSKCPWLFEKQLFLLYCQTRLPSFHDVFKIFSTYSESFLKVITSVWIVSLPVAWPSLSHVPVVWPSVSSQASTPSGSTHLPWVQVKLWNSPDFHLKHVPVSYSWESQPETNWHLPDLKFDDEIYFREVFRDLSSCPVFWVCLVISILYSFYKHISGYRPWSLGQHWRGSLRG